MDDWKNRFKVGDRVTLTIWVANWQGRGLGPGGTIFSEAQIATGGGSAEARANLSAGQNLTPEQEKRAWGVRWDGFDYRTNDNQHRVWDGAIEHETNDDDIEAAIASIAAAVRNTKEK